jgi:FeS assembly SUF system protein
MTDYSPADADLAPPPVTAVSANPRPKTVAEGGTPVPGSTLSSEELDQLTADIVLGLKTVTDPEIPADIYELGLIYKIDIADDRYVTIDMTLTSPGCPVAGEMPGMVENAVNTVPGVQGCTVNLTFDPPWDKDRMSEEAKLACGMY